MNIMNKITLKSLRKNRTRTIVTIIGVILSAAMITAVTTFLSSMQAYMLKFTIEREGDWHGVIQNAALSDYQQLQNEKDLEDVVMVKNDGFAYLPESRNEYKPYLRVMEVQEQAFAHLPIRLIEGRLPQNGNEVVISEHIYTNGGVEYKIGDTLTLQLGQRIFEDGTPILENAGYSLPEDGNPEKLDITKERTFTVVGICKRTSYQLEEYTNPGYSIFTKLNREDIQEGNSISIYFKAKHPKEIYRIIDRISKERGGIYSDNAELLRYMGISNNSGFNAVLYSLGAILISLIMAGSVSLIYNSFAISVSERKKQFGLLSSVGATGKQRMNTVICESLMIAVIGIPIGVLSGIAGIGVTLYVLREPLHSIFSYESSAAELSLAVSVPAIVAAVVISLVTILLSVYVPARRSRKVSAMDAIRQTGDIKLSAKQVKTRKIIRRLFGMEGDLALKNFKRNRKRYRTTVISLFISIVLFVAASSFAMYLKDSVTDVYEEMEYDIVYTIYDTDPDIESNRRKAYQDILALDGIEQGSMVDKLYGTVELTKDFVENDYYNTMKEQDYLMEDGKVPITVSICSVDHAAFTDYVNKLGLSIEQFTNPKSPSGILIDKQHYYSDAEQKYQNKNIFKDKTIQSLPITFSMKEDEEETINVSIGAFADTALFGVDNSSQGNFLTLIIDEQSREAYANMEDQWQYNMYFSAKDPEQAVENMKEILVKAKMPSTNLYNLTESMQENRNVIMVISVFSYGFIVLISLITIANVFNTISTNVNLRRREFAMLKSVGMTQHGFNKMLNFECIFYGLKALLYGLPVSVGITYLIYKSINHGVEMPFYLPVSSMVISSLSVFLVVFVSMLYSMSKIRNENILDALKSETN